MFEIDDVEGKYAKYANNTEFNGEKFTTGWTLPVEYNLTREQFEAAFDRKHITRAMFDEKKGEFYSLWKDWTKAVFHVTTEFKNAAFSMTFVGGKKVEFDDDCGITKIEFEAIDGGMIRVAHSVYVHPNAEQKRLLEQFQHSTVHITIADAEIASKVADKQQDMFTKSDGTVPPSEPNYAEGSTIENGDGTQTTLKSGKEIDDEMAKNEAAANAQVAGFGRGRPAKKGGSKAQSRKGAH